MKKTYQGITLLELIAVLIIISIVVGLGVPSYQRMMWKIREREIVTQLTAIHGASQIYKARNSDYYQSGSAINAAGINTALGTNIIEQIPVEFSYIGSAGVYEATGWHNDSDSNFTVRMRINESIDVGNPCCVAGSCPSLPVCV